MCHEQGSKNAERKGTAMQFMKSDLLWKIVSVSTTEFIICSLKKKKKLLQVAANYFFYTFSGFPASKLLHYRNVKCILLRMQVLKSVL